MTNNKNQFQNQNQANVSLIYEEKMRQLNQARENAAIYLQKNGLGDVEQTKITLFLQSTRFVNSLILPKIELQKMEWQSYKFFNQQLNKNMQISYLLTRATKWTLNYQVYLSYSQVVASFWDQAEIGRYIQTNFMEDANGIRLYEFLAFSHALLSEVRFTPVVVDLPSDDYTALLNEIEEDNGRQIQLQVRLLKSMVLPLTLDEREDISLAERIKVSEVYKRFLIFLCEG